MTKKEAQAAAKKLVAKLGKGWKSRVWENLGWNFAACNGNLSVYQYGTRCTALLGDNTPLCGNGCWHVDTNDKDPIKAVKKAVRAARKKVNECLASVEAAEKLLGLGTPVVAEEVRTLPTGWKRTTKTITVDGIRTLATIVHLTSKKRKGK
jgi:hypothetical protein